jgi:DNA-binding NarL/FixJ family response regulator
VQSQLLAGSPGARDAAAVAAHEAVEVLRPTTGRLEYARALAALGRLSPPDEAVTLLSEAADILWRCCADGEHREVVAMLATLGAPAPAEPHAATRLTTMERQVVQRYLGGASERDIAQALLLTPQTVRALIDAARERVGVASRIDLRAAIDP